MGVAGPVFCWPVGRAPPPYRADNHPPRLRLLLEPWTEEGRKPGEFVRRGGWTLANHKGTRVDFSFANTAADRTQKLKTTPIPLLMKRLISACVVSSCFSVALAGQRLSLEGAYGVRLMQ